MPKKLKVFFGERHEVSAEERATEVTKRILKLRWMGMEDEVEQMRVALQRVANGGSFRRRVRAKRISNSQQFPSMVPRPIEIRSRLPP